MLKPLLVLVGAQLTGEFIVALFHLRFPAPIMGMLVLVAILGLRKGVPPALDRLTRQLFPYIPLLLIPISVGVLQYRQQLDGHIAAISLAIAVSTVVGVATCGLVLKWLLGR